MGCAIGSDIGHCEKEKIEGWQSRRIIIRCQGPVDLRSIGRDDLMPYLALTPLAMGLGVRFVIPYAAGLIHEATGFDLIPYYPLLINLLTQAMPLVAYFVSGPWQWAFGLVPTFWPARFGWALQAGDPAAGLILLAGWAYQVCLLALMIRRFRRMPQKEA